jgi:[ribosomal protein S5]-alanine N-acetyltransferase
MPSNLRFPDVVPELVGETVSLRELTEEDIPAWFERATDIESADLAGDPVPDSIAMGTTWLQRHRDRFRERAAIRWAVVPRDTPESVGTVGLIIKSSEDRIADLAVVIGRAWWGRGIGTAAAHLATNYGFETLGLAQIRAEALQRNVASIRVLEKLGFRLLGVAAGDPGSEPDSEVAFRYALPNHAKRVT